MKTILKSKAGLALFAVAAIGMSVPAYAAPGDHRRGGYSRYSGHQHNSHRGAVLGLAIGAVALGAILSSRSAYASPPAYYAPAQAYYTPAPTYYAPSQSYYNQGYYDRGNYNPGYSNQSYYNQGYQAPAQQQGYWHYCADSGAYYPYVQQCAGGWQQVQPNPGR